MIPSAILDHTRMNTFSSVEPFLPLVWPSSLHSRSTQNSGPKHEAFPLGSALDSLCLTISIINYHARVPELCARFSFLSLGGSLRSPLSFQACRTPFAGFCPQNTPASPLESTLPSHLRTVHSKRLAGLLNHLESTLTQEGRGTQSSTDFSLCQLFPRPS